MEITHEYLHKKILKAAAPLAIVDASSCRASLFLPEGKNLPEISGKTVSRTERRTYEGSTLHIVKTMRRKELASRYGELRQAGFRVQFSPLFARLDGNSCILPPLALTDHERFELLSSTVKTFVRTASQLSGLIESEDYWWRVPLNWDTKNALSELFRETEMIWGSFPSLTTDSFEYAETKIPSLEESYDRYGVEEERKESPLERLVRENIPKTRKSRSIKATLDVLRTGDPDW